MSRTAPAFLVPAVLLVLGCSSEPPAPVATTSAAPTAPPITLASYCEAACARAADCGIEKASDLAKTSRLDRTAIDDAESRRAEIVATCNETCRRDSANDGTLARAEKCVHSSSCKVFESCLEELARAR